MADVRSFHEDRPPFSFAANSDNIGVTGYLIYRGGTLVGLVSGSVTSYVDRTTAPLTTYSYTVAAIDGAGNLSAASSAASATTPASSAGLIAVDRFGRTVSSG